MPCHLCMKSDKMASRSLAGCQINLEENKKGGRGMIEKKLLGYLLFTVASFFCLIFMPSLALSDADDMSENEMVQKLSASKPHRTRGVRHESHQKRSIKVIAKTPEDIAPSEQVITVDEEASKNNLKLSVEFDWDSDRIRPEAYPLLKKLARALRDPSLSYNFVCIMGHTDSDGSEEYNLRLSFRRAYSVMNFLLSEGLKKELFRVYGYGESKPCAPNDTPENKQKNRRVEVSLDCET